MYYEIPSMLTLLLKNFAIAVFTSNNTYILLSQYEYIYVGINTILISQYIMHIPIKH